MIKKTREEKKYGRWVSMKDVPTVFLYSPIEFAKLNEDRSIDGETHILSKNDFRLGNVTIAKVLEAGATHWRYLASNRRAIIAAGLKKQGLI